MINVQYVVCFHLLLFVVQLVGEDGLHPEEVRGRAPRLGDGHQVRGVRGEDRGPRGLVRMRGGQDLGARQVERGDGDTGQVLGLGLRGESIRLNGPVNKSICDSLRGTLCPFVMFQFIVLKLETGGNPAHLKSSSDNKSKGLKNKYISP